MITKGLLDAVQEIVMFIIFHMNGLNHNNSAILYKFCSELLNGIPFRYSEIAKLPICFRWLAPDYRPVCVFYINLQRAVSGPSATWRAANGPL